MGFLSAKAAAPVNSDLGRLGNRRNTAEFRAGRDSARAMVIALAVIWRTRSRAPGPSALTVDPWAAARAFNAGLRCLSAGRWTAGTGYRDAASPISHTTNSISPDPRLPPAARRRTVCSRQRRLRCVGRAWQALPLGSAPRYEQQG